MKIFVPGRLCLFGEHSDWAGGYRHVNPALEKGYTLIASTNQGIYAEVKPNSTNLIIKTTLNDSTKIDEIVLSMDRVTLLAEAEKGGFFSYAAGVAYQFLTHYLVKGKCFDTGLPDVYRQTLIDFPNSGH